MQNLTNLQRHIQVRFGQVRKAARYLGYDVKEYREAIGMNRYYVEDWKGDIAYGAPAFNHAVTIDQIMQWLDERAAECLSKMEQQPAT